MPKWQPWRGGDHTDHSDVRINVSLPCHIYGAQDDVSEVWDAEPDLLHAFTGCKPSQKTLLSVGKTDQVAERMKRVTSATSPKLAPIQNSDSLSVTGHHCSYQTIAEQGEF